MVVKKCCVAKCKSKSTRKEDARVTYHKFPKVVAVRDTWVKVTRHSHSDVELNLVNKYVCSRHFLLTDFHHYQGRYVLKSGAVPTVFPWKKMDELDSLTTTEDTENDKRNLSTSSKESEPENLEAIKKFLLKHDKEELVEDNGIQNENKRTDDIKIEIDESLANSSMPIDRDETLAIATSVVDLIFNESADKLSKNESLTQTSSTNDKSSTSVALSVGSKVEARDFAESWYSAEIVEVDYDEMEVLVRFESFTKKPEEWISVNSPRLRPVTAEIKLATMKSATSADDEKYTKVKPATVNTTEVAETTKDEERMENKPKMTFAVGERCLARWRDNRRFVATIQSDFGDGTYGIIFDDGFHWKCSVNRLSKLKSSSKIDSTQDSRGCSTPSPTPGAGPSTSAPILPMPIFHTHLFDPTRDYLGSKSERREQKRKLNIKEIFNIGQKQRKKEKPVKKIKSKISKEKKPRRYNKKAKVELNTETRIEKKDIPDAIASIIGTVNNDGENISIKKVSIEKRKKKVKGIKRYSEMKDPLDNEGSTSKVIRKKKGTLFYDDVEDFENTDVGNIKPKKKSVVNVSDEDTQSAKLSDAELDSFDDHDVNLSGDQDAKLSDDQDGKLSIDKIHEEDKLQNFEKPDDVIHEQVMDRIKEAINKLEDGLNRELNASPKVNKEFNPDSSNVNTELNLDVPKIKKDIKLDSSKVLKLDYCKPSEELIADVNTELNDNSPIVNRDVNIDSPKMKKERNADSPKMKRERNADLPKMKKERNADLPKVDTELNADSLEVNRELDADSPKTEIVKEEEEIPAAKIEIKPEPSTSKIKKSKKRSKNLLKLAKRIKVLGQEEKAGAIVEISTKLENIKKEMKEILMMFEQEVPDSSPPEGEWCCKWVNGEPVGTVIETEPDNRIDVLNKIALPRKTVQVEDKRLPEGWTKLMVRRSLGHSAGKWDVVLVSPDNRRFHTKTDMRQYLENSTDPALKSHEHALLDFAVHLKLARRMGWVTGDSGHASRSLVNRPLSRKRKKLMLKKERKVKKRKLSADGRYKFDRASVPGTSGSSLLGPSGNLSYNNSTLEDGYVYVGSLKVQVIDNLLRCPADNCFKNFRNNTLLQMHIKHYHRELRKSLGATPKVLDLAYARTMPTETETRQRHEPDNKIIKVKIPRPPKRIEEKLDMKEINIEPRGDSPSPMPVKIPRLHLEKIPRSLDSPMMRQFALQNNRPVKRPRVLLPVRRPEPVEPPPELESMDDMQDLSMDTSQLEPKLSIPPQQVLDFESAISSHTVSKPGEVKRRPEKRKVFATISKAPLSEDEDMTGMNSDLDTRSSLPGSGTPDSKTMEPRSIVQIPMSSESNEDTAMYMYTETGERIKLERMKREEIINCHCGFREEDGLMVQCELCLCWQHALCHNIQREADVPQKYTCSICLNPRRGRRSQRFMHDQDRMNEGLLPGARPSEPLRRSHDISGNLLNIADALQALRVKYYVATKKNHPKLYLWAKDWDNPEAAFVQEKPNAYSDLNVIMNNMNTSKSNVRVRNDESARVEMETPTEDQEDRLSQNGSLSNHSLLGGLLGSPVGPSLEMPISTSELERLAKSVQEQAESRPVVTAPQPEAAIENGACRERLLRHVQRCQALIDARLDTLEAEIIELEAQDPSFEDDETADYFPRTKQTVQMLMRDLQSLQQLGLIT